MFEKRSKSTFIATVLAIVYSVYLIGYSVTTASQASGDAESVGTGIALLLILPHLLLTALGAIFGVIAFFTRKAGLALTASIIYSVAAVAFILYAAFLIPSIVFGFIGFNAQRKLNSPA